MREVKVFRENFQVRRVPTRQFRRQALFRHSIGRCNQRIAVEHQHRFFWGAESSYRPADGETDPRNATHSEWECEPLDSVQQHGDFAGQSFPFLVDPRSHRAR